MISSPSLSPVAAEVVASPSPVTAPASAPVAPVATEAVDSISGQLTQLRLVNILKSGTIDAIETALGETKTSDYGLYRRSLRAYFNEVLAGEGRLQRHVMPFDESGDRRISMGEVYRTSRAFGFSSARAIRVVIVSNLIAGPSTWETWGEFFGAIAGGFEINVDGIHRAQHHGVNTGAFNEGSEDAEVKKSLDRLFSFATGPDGSLTREDVQRSVDAMAQERAEASGTEVDAFAHKANSLEFKGAFSFVSGETLSRQDIEDFFNGSLVYAALEPSTLAQRIINLR